MTNRRPPEPARRAVRVASRWGTFIWKEFRGASQGTGRLLSMMVVAYVAGIVLIEAATSR